MRINKNNGTSRGIHTESRICHKTSAYRQRIEHSWTFNHMSRFYAQKRIIDIHIGQFCWSKFICWISQLYHSMLNSLFLLPCLPVFEYNQQKSASLQNVLFSCPILSHSNSQQQWSSWQCRRLKMRCIKCDSKILIHRPVLPSCWQTTWHLRNTVTYIVCKKSMRSCFCLCDSAS